MHSPWWRIAVTRCFVLARSVSTVAIVGRAAQCPFELSSRRIGQPLALSLSLCRVTSHISVVSFLQSLSTPSYQ